MGQRESGCLTYEDNEKILAPNTRTNIPIVGRCTMMSTPQFIMEVPVMIGHLTHWALDSSSNSR